MILTGTLVNAAGILLGGGAGLLVHRLMRRGVPERFSDMVMKGIGLCTVYIAATGLLDGSKALVTILSVVLGAVLGEWLDLDGKIRALSGALERRFSRPGDAGFAQGFMAATLLFCVGTMAIKGAALAGCFHNVNRSVNSACKDSLSDAFCLEQTAVSQHLVQFYMFFLKKDIHTCLKRAKRCIQMYSHKVCQIKFALR